MEKPEFQEYAEGLLDRVKQQLSNHEWILITIARKKFENNKELIQID